MRLHLGCGKKKIMNWINVDIDEEASPDINDDISILSKFEDESADLIYASHVLEHFKRTEYIGVLRTWYSKLKPGGVLRIAVPDFNAVVLRYKETGNIGEVTGLVCGGQRNEFDIHFIIFDKKLLTHALEECGFRDVREWDWRATDHCDMDDYSQAYLPHMDKESGMLMSLNLEATKPK